MFISPRQTGHTVARDGRLLRVDQAGARWVATRFNPDLTLHDAFYGTEQEAHAMLDHWRILPGSSSSPVSAAPPPAVPAVRATG